MQMDSAVSEAACVMTRWRGPEGGKVGRWEGGVQCAVCSVQRFLWGLGSTCTTKCNQV